MRKLVLRLKHFDSFSSKQLFVDNLKITKKKKLNF